MYATVVCLYAFNKDYDIWRQTQVWAHTRKIGHLLDRYVSPEEYFSGDKVSEYPRHQYDGRKQLKIPNRTINSERELSRRLWSWLVVMHQKKTATRQMTQERPIIVHVVQSPMIDAETSFLHHHQVSQRSPVIDENDRSVVMSPVVIRKKKRMHVRKDNLIARNSWKHWNVNVNPFAGT